MPFHDRSDTRTPATCRTTRPGTYRTTSPAAPVSGPVIHGTAGQSGAQPHIVAPKPAGPSRAPWHPTPESHDSAGDLTADAWPAGARRTGRVRYVDSDCLIGVRDPHRPDLVRARSVGAGGHPRVMLPILRRLWTAAGRDSTRLAARLLAYDWLYLDPATPASPATATTPRTAAHGHHSNSGNLQGVTGRRVIAGVGITHAVTGPDGADDGEPVTVVPLAHLGTLDTGWLYLLEPKGHSVTVHTGDGGLLSRCLLVT